MKSATTGGFLACVMVFVVGLYLWGLMKFGYISPVPAAKIGLICGSACGLVLYLFPYSIRSSVVGALFTISLWALYAYFHINNSGLKISEIYDVFEATVVFAGIGTLGGMAYDYGKNIPQVIFKKN